MKPEQHCMHMLACPQERRGFYPRGGGVLRVQAPALPPGTPLPPLDLATRGNITKVSC